MAAMRTWNSMKKSNELIPSSQNADFVDEIGDQSNYSVTLSGSSESYSIGLVDIVNSTRIIANLPQNKVCGYFEIFLNSLSKVIGRFGGVVIKNVGDSLLFTFPNRGKTSSKFGFMSCLECSLSLIEERPLINKILVKEGLPTLNYRVSVDYGSVVTMKSNKSSSIDVIGSPVNMCTKINRMAAVNGIIIGGDLYEMVKDFDDYYFKPGDDYSIGLKNSYPVYSVRRKN